MDGVFKDHFGRLFYNTKKKVAEWTVDVEFRSQNLTVEQSALANKIVNENKERTLWQILDALAHAGFRGDILRSTDFLSPTVVVINSKIEIDKQ